MTIAIEYGHFDSGRSITIADKWYWTTLLKGTGYRDKSASEYLSKMELPMEHDTSNKLEKAYPKKEKKLQLVNVTVIISELVPNSCQCMVLQSLRFSLLLTKIELVD